MISSPPWTRAGLPPPSRLRFRPPREGVGKQRRQHLGHDRPRRLRHPHSPPKVRVCRTANRFAVLPCGTPGSGEPRSDQLGDASTRTAPAPRHDKPRSSRTVFRQFDVCYGALCMASGQGGEPTPRGIRPVISCVELSAGTHPATARGQNKGAGSDATCLRSSAAVPASSRQFSLVLAECHYGPLPLQSKGPTRSRRISASETNPRERRPVQLLSWLLTAVVGWHAKAVGADGDGPPRLASGS